ncbi:MAG: hypothetical protein QXP42_01980 [Candidatus Micrarchaeia archaeon]
MICQRCSKEIHLLENCDFCQRLVCVSCIKSSRRLSKVERIVICKDCWSDNKKRQEFKSR